MSLALFTKGVTSQLDPRTVVADPYSRVQDSSGRFIVEQNPQDQVSSSPGLS